MSLSGWIAGIGPGVGVGIIVALFSVGITQLAISTRERRSRMRRREQMLGSVLQEVKHNRRVVEQFKSMPTTGEVPAKLRFDMWIYFRMSDTIRMETDSKLFEAAGESYRLLESADRLMQRIDIADASKWVSPQEAFVKNSMQSLANAADAMIEQLRQVESLIETMSGPKK